MDIGDHVQAGQLLAQIDTPETDADLLQARATVVQMQANLTNAQADYDYARTTLDRYKKAIAEGRGAQQDLDTKQSAVDTTKAAIDVANAAIVAAQASVKRLEELQSFEKVVALFPGTITARNVDVGALISSGSSGTSRELLHLAQTDTLRVFVNVPQEFVPAIKPGLPAELIVRLCRPAFYRQGDAFSRGAGSQHGHFAGGSAGAQQGLHPAAGHVRAGEAFGPTGQADAAGADPRPDDRG